MMSTLEFKDIGYSVKLGKGKNVSYKTILSGVNATLKGGELVAIIGSSGAGKTTLLNIISGRIVGGTVAGQILYNGEPRNKRTFRRDVAYVEQDDLMYPTLTAKETIGYAAKFRLPNDEFSPQQKEQRVEDTIRSLRLTKSENTFIGDDRLKGLSGGERKRVSIGMEIVTEPKVLILDEPTSGLDSNSSIVVVKLIKGIAVENNLICISSIHQPNSKIFYTFDKVILMAPGGLTYFGTTQDSLEYFSSIGYECPSHENPADYFIDIMTINYEDESSYNESLQRVEHLKKSWSSYTAKNGIMYLGKRQPESPYNMPNQNRTFVEKERVQEINQPRWRNSWFNEYSNLLGRSWLRLYRDKPVLISYAASGIFTLLLIGFTFFNPGVGIAQANNKIGLIFILIINMVFPVTMPLLPVLIRERRVMTRERASSSYRMSTFLLSIMSTYVPLSLAVNFCALTGIYFLTKLQVSASNYFIFIAIFFSAILNSLGIALAVSAIAPNEQVATIIAPLVLTIFVIYGGSLVNSGSVTPILAWLRFISYIYYTYMAAMQNEMRGLVFDCTGNTSGTCYPTGESVLKSFKLEELTIWACVGINLAMAAAYFLGAYLIIRFKTKPRYILI
ncbi:ABC transporter G family member 22 [Smittium mucronatum]|uniref:ABC transporter G family member 22 n=1 Tax=Smittium mucronatum TaxID=133383 RepID=A0A1R0H448_9FUNG|nr:ABC transporter G family member 22 [Smittium mucronatum]